MAKEADVSTRTTQRLVREGELVAEVDVTLIETDDGWTPHLSLEDACKLDDVRNALRVGDVVTASRLANRVYRLTPIEA
ncbi:MAG: hypothetical protein U0893_13965 [Chloroflexota bacterium]